jgi:hypothetical protein
VLNPTEIKKNGPAKRPASTPARCSVALFTAASAVLPATAQSYGDARDIVNGAAQIRSNVTCSSRCRHSSWMRSMLAKPSEGCAGAGPDF